MTESAISEAPSLTVMETEFDRTNNEKSDADIIALFKTLSDAQVKKLVAERLKSNQEIHCRCRICSKNQGACLLL
jgi:hypothetical protein